MKKNIIAEFLILGLVIVYSVILICLAIKNRDIRRELMLCKVQIADCMEQVANLADIAGDIEDAELLERLQCLRHMGENV